MADTPAEVIAFLRDLASRAKPFAEKDMAALRAFAADELDIADMQPSGSGRRLRRTGSRMPTISHKPLLREDLADLLRQ
jgi:hypothetical protein